jgi:hypothetical protein
MSGHEIIVTKDGYEVHFVYHEGGMVVRIAKEAVEISARGWHASDANHEAAAKWAREHIRAHRKAVRTLKRT